MSVAPLVVLEGIDGSGKGTQAAAVTSRLQQRGLNVEQLSFPRYAETFFGQRIGEFLNGKFGELDAVHPFLVSLLYAGDRLESLEVLQTARERCDLVLLDRFVHSNIAHQAAKGTVGDRQSLREWMEHVEHVVFKVPRPELVILLELPVAAAQELIGRKRKRSYTDRDTDLQEADADYLARVAECYDQLAEEPGWRRVQVTEAGLYRPVEAITDEIVEIITALPGLPQGV